LLSAFRLTGGEAGDSPQALPRLGTLKPDSLCADKAYDSDAILEHLAHQGIQPVIPPRRQRLIHRTFDPHRYKNRNLIERLFCRIKQFRRIATRYDKLAERYDKLAERFASFVTFTASVIWLT
jgi:transposase